MIVDVDISSDHYGQFALILGHKTLFRSLKSPFYFIQIATQGLKAEGITSFSNYFEISKEETAQKLNVSIPTLYRWTKANNVVDRNCAVRC